MKYRKEVIELVKKAQKSLEAAKELFNKDYSEFSVSRAYYAMFYCAEALLLSKGLSFSKHSAVISFFGKEFVKTGLMPKKLHGYIRRAFEDRGVGDYETIPIERETSEETIRRAEEFLNETKNYLEIE